MVLPLIAVAAASTVARFIATKGLQKAIKKYGPKLITKGKKYIKDNKLVVTGKNTVKTGKGRVTKVTNASKAKGGGTKINTTPKKKITATNTKPNKNTKPKNTGPSKAKGGGKISGPTKGLIAVGTTVPFLFGNKSKDSSTNTTNPKKDRDFRKRLQQDDAYSMDKMLDSKPVPKGPDRKREARPKQGGGFGTNISFASKDVKSLRENARKLTSQIDNLSISSSEKRRLKSMYSRDKVDNRKSGFSMNTVYNKAFQEIKKKVK